MRIAYLTANDPKDRRSWSGTLYYMAQALEKHCGEVFYLGPLSLRITKVGKILSRLLRTVGVTYLYTHTNAISRKIGEMADRKLANINCDVIFAPAGSVMLASLRSSLPIVYLSDTTFNLMKDYNPEFDKLAKWNLNAGERLESAAIRKSKHIVYPSSWAAQSAIRDYGAAPPNVHVVPFGANIESWPDRQLVLGDRSYDRCRLLFVGRDWSGKGGDIAFEALVELQNGGIPAQLTIVGCTPPRRFQHPNLRVIPFLNKNNPEERAELENLYLTAHFALLPTRSECFSIALCEANAYGLPILSTYTGGLPELVREGVNGFLLPLEARGPQYAAKIRELYNDSAAYASLRESSRKEFETRLNWDVWGKKLAVILQSAIDQSNRTAVHIA